MSTTAVWMMRALVVSNVLSRREGVVLFVPVNPAIDPNGARVAEAVVRIASAQGGTRWVLQRDFRSVKRSGFERKHTSESR